MDRKIGQLNGEESIEDILKNQIYILRIIHMNGLRISLRPFKDKVPLSPMEFRKIFFVEIGESFDPFNTGSKMVGLISGDHVSFVNFHC